MWKPGSLLGLVTCLLAFNQVHSTMFDPCSDITPAARGDAFPVGLLLIPGANATDLAAELALTFLGVCNTTLQQAIIAKYNARIAVFNLRLDRLHVLRLPYPDIIFPLVAADPPTLVVVAFRKNVYSAPAYLANGSNNTQIHGAGFVVSLALLVTLNEGILTTLHWYDLTCNACGGSPSQLCIHQIGLKSCATAFTNCTCAGNPQLQNCTYADTTFDKCSTSINTGFLGTDAFDQAFRTGPQIQRLNAYSLVSLYYKAKDAVMDQYNNVYGDISSNWEQVSEDSKSQQVDFGGGIGSTRSTNIRTTSPPPSPLPPPAPPPSPPDAPKPPGFGGR